LGVVGQQRILGLGEGAAPEDIFGEQILETELELVLIDAPRLVEVEEVEVEADSVLFL
jgi:hypothetical protein